MSLSLSLVWGFFYATLGQVLIYSATAFINGAFFGRFLHGIYDHTTPFSRLVIASATLFPLANYLISKIFRVTDAGYAGMLIIITLVLVLAGKALLLGVGEMSWRVVLSVAVLTCAAAWVSYELHRVA